MGPMAPCSTVLTADEEAVIVAFRKHTLLSLDDCLYALQATIPHLTRSSLHRCLQRHGISRLPDIEGDKPGKMRWSPFGGQIGGFAKLGSGLRHAASSMSAGVMWTSAGVCPPKAV